MPKQEIIKSSGTERFALFGMTRRRFGTSRYFYATLTNFYLSVKEDYMSKLA